MTANDIAAEFERVLDFPYNARMKAVAIEVGLLREAAKTLRRLRVDVDELRAELSARS